MHIKGKCHCGNIDFSLDWPADASEIPARACGCSFCIKHGGVWTANPAATMRANIHDDSLVSKYEFGTRTAIFYICSRCGAVPFATSEIDGNLYAVANVNTFEGLDQFTLVRSAANFDSEDKDSRLARRTRNWIAGVAIFVGSKAVQ
jgi:hypothetical protein